MIDIDMKIFDFVNLIYFLGLVVVIALVCGLALLIHRFAGKRADSESKGYIVRKEISFEGKLRKYNMKPDRDIMFGPNEFAYDARKGRTLIRCGVWPDGSLLRTRDILSYEMIKDGQTIRRWPYTAGTMNPYGDDGESKVLCRDMKIIIKSSHKWYREIVMPFITFPIESPQVYAEALEAATGIADILDTVLQASQQEKAKELKTSLD